MDRRFVDKIRFVDEFFCYEKSTNLVRQEFPKKKNKIVWAFSTDLALRRPLRQSWRLGVCSGSHDSTPAATRNWPKFQIDLLWPSPFPPDLAERAGRPLKSSAAWELRKSSNQAETLIYILRKQRTLDRYSRSSLYVSIDCRWVCIQYLDLNKAWRIFNLKKIIFKLTQVDESRMDHLL